MWCIYNYHCLDIVMIIWSFINCPTVICLPTRCYFSREKPLVKSTAPRSLVYYIFLGVLFLFAFIFRSINPKIQKYLAAIFIYLFYLAFPRDLFIQSTTILPIFFTREGLTTPLLRRVASICFLCAGAIYVVLHGSRTGSITLISSLREIPTVVVLHHPFLFGEIPT